MSTSTDSTNTSTVTNQDTVITNSTTNTTDVASTTNITTSSSDTSSTTSTTTPIVTTTPTTTPSTTSTITPSTITTTTQSTSSTQPQVIPPVAPQTNQHVACLFGLQYSDSHSRKLSGVYDDIDNVAKFLITSGFTEVTCLKDDKNNSEAAVACTMQGMLCMLNSLVKRSWDECLDTIWIHYIGQRAFNDVEGLCPSDVETAGVIVGDTLLSIVLSMNPQTQVILCLDGCYSGPILPLRHLYRSRVDREDMGGGGEYGMRKVIAFQGVRDLKNVGELNTAMSHHHGVRAMSRALVAACMAAPALVHDVFSLLDACRQLMCDGQFLQSMVIGSSYDLSALPRMFLSASEVTSPNDVNVGLDEEEKKPKFFNFNIGTSAVRSQLVPGVVEYRISCFFGVEVTTEKPKRSVLSVIKTYMNPVRWFKRDKESKN